MGKYNIWSGNKDWPLGAALTNCTCLAHKKGNIKNQYPVSFQGVIWEDAEQAYISLSRRCRDDGARDKLMVNIIAAKLKQHPQLKTLVDRYGGIAFLERCEHTTYAQSERFRKWEGVGRESRFIRNLIAAYLVAVVEAVPLTPQRYSLLSPPQRRQLRPPRPSSRRTRLAAHMPTFTMVDLETMGNGTGPGEAIGTFRLVGYSLEAIVDYGAFGCENGLVKF